MQIAASYSSFGSEGHLQLQRVPRTAKQSGNVFDMSKPAMDIELVLGFRPGVDKLKLPLVGRLGFSEAHGNVVISHKSGEIILQGVTLAELANGLDAD